MLRRRGVETRAAASATAPWVRRTVGLSDSSVNVRQVPNTVPPSDPPTVRLSDARSSATPMSEMTVLGSCCRRFMLG